VQKVRVEKGLYDGKGSQGCRIRGHPDDIQRDSFHFPGSSLKANKRYVIQCVLVVSVRRLIASVLGIACAGISSVQAVFNMLML